MSDDDKLPDGYVATMETMHRAALAWMKAHPFAELRFSSTFEEEIKQRAGVALDTKVAIGATLAEVVDLFGENADARAFLRHMVTVTNGAATYMMMKALLDLQQEARIRAVQGQLDDASGDWRCPCCATKLDGYTPADGEPAKPGPGALTVCMYCLAVARVAETGDRFESIPSDEWAAHPQRAEVEAVRDGIRKSKQRLS